MMNSYQRLGGQKSTIFDLMQGNNQFYPETDHDELVDNFASSGSVSLTPPPPITENQIWMSSSESFQIPEEIRIFPIPRWAWCFSKSQTMYEDSPIASLRRGARNNFKLQTLYIGGEL